jgi:ribosomal protein S18 acetylase RimI-like enzyme
MRYHHIGIPSSVPRDGEVFLAEFKLHVQGFEDSPYGVEWLRFEGGSPLPELVKSVPHVAFVVDDLETALKGKEVIIPPNRLMQFDSAQDEARLCAGIEVHPLGDARRAWAKDLLEERWGSPRIVSRGRIHDADRLPGFVALAAAGFESAGGSREPCGLVTYRIDGLECEMVSLDALRERRGAGSALVAAVVTAARAASCRRLWLITTNDNTRALRFYQRRGFTLAALHKGAIEASRRLKPSIARVGMDGIPIRDEIELEMLL